MGINSTALKQGKEPFDNTRTKNAIIETHVEDVSSIEKMKDSKEMLETIRSTLKQGEKEIAYLIPHDIFQVAKQLQKKGELSAYCDEK
jgi:hypothetical protein